MQSQNENKQCMKEDCEYNYPYIRPHYHVVTVNGSYVKFIVERVKSK